MDGIRKVGVLESAAEPLLRWPGGKRWAAKEIAKIISEHLRRTYYEPFLGGGAVFFNLQPVRAVLGDIEGELIDTYQAIKMAPDKVRIALRRLPVGKADYYRIRKSKARTIHTRAARFLYLNRTAFAGIHRRNRNGEFNVPYGGDRTPQILYDPKRLRRTSTALQSADLFHCDFEMLIDRAGHGDVVYCDPTYTVAHGSNGFQRYNDRIFSWQDQMRLLAVSRRAVARGATVVISNAYHRSLRLCYKGVPRRILHRQSRVSASAAARRAIKEYLFIMAPDVVE